MAPLLSCKFDMDTVCVELKFSDGNMISIDCTVIENEIVDICISVQHCTIQFTMILLAMPTLSLTATRGNLRKM